MNLFNTKYDLQKSFTSQAIEYLTNYSWPGNVRELSNVIERVVVTSSNEVIEAAELPEEITENSGGGENLQEDIPDLNKALEQLESKLVKQAWEKYHTTTGVAKALKISQPTAFRKVSKYIKEES